MTAPDPAGLEGTAYLSLQNPCNASCPMCLSWRDDSVLPLAAVLDAVVVLAEEGWRRIIFTGGEFATYPGFDELLRRTDECGLDFGFITNGTVLDPAREELFGSPRLTKVVLSRDFADPERHASWRKLPVFSDAAITRAFADLSARGVFCQVNTVLMPSNADDLPHFPALPYWPSLDVWHLIPVKGAMAKTWTEQSRARLAETWAALSAGLTIDDSGPGHHPTPVGPTLIGPIVSGFADVPLQQIRSSRPTEAAVHGHICGVEQGQIYVDASGHVLPCNSIAWEERRTVGFGNLHADSMRTVLQRRTRALAAQHNAARRGCHACDPLNFAANAARRAAAARDPQPAVGGATVPAQP
jgi:radical SAM protein with 4Fe4S-binding SPASM domain